MKAERLAQAFDEYTLGKTGKALSTAIDECMHYVTVRGYTALLPHILATLKVAHGEEKKEVILTIAEKTNEKKILKDLDLHAKDVEIERNDNIIGGYILETRTTFEDNTYRKQLLKLYKSIAH